MDVGGFALFNHVDVRRCTVQATSRWGGAFYFVFGTGKEVEKLVSSRE